jgi:hypothetical protein
MSTAMAGEKIKLKEEAISKILVADTDSESKNVLRLERRHNTGQRNHPTNCAVVCVLLVTREREQCINVPDVLWACA